MSRFTIQIRLTLWNIAVLGMCLALFGVLLVILTQHRLSQRYDHDLVEELNELVDEIRLVNSSVHLSEQLAQRFTIHGDYHFQVSDAQGQSLFQSRLLEHLQVPVARLEGNGYRSEYVELADGMPFRTMSGLALGPDQQPLIAQVTVSLVPMYAERRAFLWAMVLAAILTLAITLVAGYVLARTILAPIGQLASAAERISAENLRERLPVANEGDELGRLARTLNQLLDRVGDAVEQMRRFTADAAHELRSPIAVMRTESEVALRAPQDQVDWRRVVEITVDESSRLSGLVDQLLLLSRCENQSMHIEREDVPMHALVSDVIAAFERPAAQKGIELQIGETPACNTPGDDVLLSQLFYNLFDNAIKYTPAGGVIHFWGESSGTMIRLTLVNSGPLLDDDHLTRIFERFYRVQSDRGRDTGGAGLGLAICKSIVEAHEGKIYAQRAAEGGNAFVVELPAKAETVDETVEV